MGNGAKAYAAIVVIRIMYSGMYVMSKVALDHGMNPLVFLFYRQATAALVLIPAVFVLERCKAKLVTLRIAGKLFIQALYGVTAFGNLFNLGLNYASASSSSAMYNVQPVVIFVLAVMFGMESIKLKKLHGNVKLVGILFCIVGVTVLALYEGPMFKSFNHHRPFQPSSSSEAHYSKKQWALRILLMILSNVLVGLWTVLQGPLMEETSKLMNTTVQITCAAVQAFVVAVASERDFSKWKLGWDISFATIIYSVRYVRPLPDELIPLALLIELKIITLVTILSVALLINRACMHAMLFILSSSIVAGVLLIAELYNVLWDKNIEETDGINKICGTEEPDVELCRTPSKEAHVADEMRSTTK